MYDFYEKFKKEKYTTEGGGAGKKSLGYCTNSW